MGWGGGGGGGRRINKQLLKTSGADQSTRRKLKKTSEGGGTPSLLYVRGLNYNKKVKNDAHELRGPHCSPLLPPAVCGWCPLISLGRETIKAKFSFKETTTYKEFSIKVSSIK